MNIAEHTENRHKANTETNPSEFAIALSREEINALPISRYEGPVDVVHTPEDVKRACKALAKESILGFDTETRPTFRKGEFYFPSLVQLAGSTSVYLFPLKEKIIPSPLKSLLSDGMVLKTGVSLAYDIKQLNAMDPFEPAGFIALEALARALRIKNQGLRGLAAAVFGFRISKRAQCSNWGRAALTPTQINYAATDAWISRRLYIELSRRLAEQEAWPDLTT